MHDTSPARLDRAADDLSLSQRFLVWAVRCWVAAHKGDASFQNLLTEGSQRMGVSAAVAPLSEVMAIIASSATRSIDVRCPNCGRVSEDEQLMLEAIAAQQHNVPGVAFRALVEFIPPTAARAVLPSISEIGGVFAAAGLYVPPHGDDRPMPPSIRAARSSAVTRLPASSNDNAMAVH